MLFTDMGTKVDWEWCPLALSNGIEWSILRKGYRDRFDSLYKKKMINRFLWYCGAILGYIIIPNWIKINADWYKNYA